MARSTTAASPAQAAPRPLTTHALCLISGATRGMLRLYESVGLIAPPQRNAAGYRHFAQDTVSRLLAIRYMKEIGFSLREIALLLAEHDQGELDPARLRELAQEQILEIDARTARLQLVRRYMVAVAEGNTTLIDDPECSFLLDFLSTSGHSPAPKNRGSNALEEKATW